MPFSQINENYLRLWQSKLKNFKTPFTYSQKRGSICGGVFDNFSSVLKISPFTFSLPNFFRIFPQNFQKFFVRLESSKIGTKKVSVCLFAEADAHLEIQFLSTLGNRRGMCLGTVKIYAQYAFSQLSIRVWDCPNKQMCRQDTMLAKKLMATLLWAVLHQGTFCVKLLKFLFLSS